MRRLVQRMTALVAVLGCGTLAAVAIAATDPQDAAPAGSTDGGTTATTPSRPHAARPSIVQRPIPFPARRRVEMRRYARHHYAIDGYSLREPHVIVEHYTDGGSVGSAWNTFAADRPDPELHELPGTCAHFIVDRDGRIYQFVKVALMCRHTVGLNWTALGIEHVGRSDYEILHNRRQLKASLRLTRWLQRRFHIRTRDVIGHNESLGSPYHHERVARLRHQTHGDWVKRDMHRYRKRLSHLPL